MTYNHPGVYHCDTCPDHIDTEEKDSRDAFRAAHSAGWRSYKGPDKEWAHSCPNCVKAWAEEQKLKGR